MNLRKTFKINLVYFNNKNKKVGIMTHIMRCLRCQRVAIVGLCSIAI
jgi:hypothetical protein